VRRAVLLACLLAALAGAGGTAQAASPFAWRGVIEGMYGPPWDHAMRMRMLAFMGDRGMNAYVHAPKDDLYQRTQWRDPYPAALMADFSREVAFARSRGVEWVPNLSPGVPLIPTPGAPQGAPSRDVCFSCPADLDVVVGKLAPFARAGARTFMVSFDDVQKVLTHPEDLAAYGTGDAAYGRATGEFLTKLLRALRAHWPGSRLLTVGADYSGTSDTDYLRAFRAVLDPGVEVMWTGTTVFSKNFDPAQARAYGKAIGREPVVWDNWTVNDLDGNGVGRTTRIYLGPYARRPNVVGAVRGFFLNPMNEADLNLLPFATAADFLNDPQGFDARASWLRAVRDLGGAQADALRAFAETSYSTHLDYGTEAPTFVAADGRLLADYAAGGRWPEARADLDAELRRVDGAEAALRRVPSLAPFVTEAAPFLSAARVAAGTGRVASALLAAERPALGVARAAGGGFAGRATPPDPGAADALRGELERRDRDNRTSTRFVFGYRRPATVDTPPTPLPPNTMDTFVDRVRSLDAGFAAGAEQAAASVALTLNGRPVALGDDGRFTLAAVAAGGTLTATDGAGGRTTVLVPAAARSAAGRPRIVSRHPRRLRGRRVRIVLSCPAPCAGLVRVRAGGHAVGSARVQARRAGRRAVVVRLRRVPRRARVLFAGARTVTIALRR
jgi:beta-N-acetylglucosaminidase-like protein